MFLGMEISEVMGSSPIIAFMSFIPVDIYSYFVNRKKPRQYLDYCGYCGYDCTSIPRGKDQTGSYEVRRCPECGTTNVPSNLEEKESRNG